MLWRLGWNSAGGGGKGVASSGDSTAATLRQAAARVPGSARILHRPSQPKLGHQAGGFLPAVAEKLRQWIDQELMFRHQHQKGTNFTCFLPKRSPSAGASLPEPLLWGLPAVVHLWSQTPGALCERGVGSTVQVYVDGCTRAWEHTQVRAQGAHTCFKS